MSEAPPSGPDLARGVAAADVADGGMLAGHFAGEAVLLARRGEEWFAVGATCTHYGGPLAEGLMVGDTVRCPWHHACFSLRTGAMLRAPALDDLARYRVERRDGIVRVTGREEAAPPAPPLPPDPPRSVVIVGAGAAGIAAADGLRRLGYGGPVTLVDSDPDAPCDRPNLSKDYLAGNAPEEWITLRGPDWFADRDIVLRRARATGLEPEAHRLWLDDGRALEYGRLLLATGAAPRRLTVPVSPEAPLYYLRTVADARALISRAGETGQAVVVGGGFIGLETAASLRARGLEVDLVTPEARPLERVMGPGLAGLIGQVHQEHGVRFHPGRSIAGIEPDGVLLDDGTRLPAGLIVAGIGVLPETSLAAAAGLATENGILVDGHLATSTPDVFAAGDVARWPAGNAGERVRIEHWVVAERQGQCAARNLLGLRERFAAAPFFWSQHYDLQISYVGHAPHWDEIITEGRLEERDAMVRFRQGGRDAAVATVFRDRASLEAELRLEGAGPAEADEGEGRRPV